MLLCSFMNAKMRSGADVLLETVNFNSLIEDADLIITGRVVQIVRH